MEEIKYPTEKTYYITYNDNTDFFYGVVETNQVLTTTNSNLYQTIDVQEWCSELKTNFSLDRGYQFDNENLAIKAVTEIWKVSKSIPPDIKEATDATPKFWYFKGDFTDIIGEPSFFKI